MAYSSYHAERIRQRLAGVNVTGEKQMMGGLVFMVNHKMCLGLDTDKNTGMDRLMARVGKIAQNCLLGQKGSKAMNFTGKIMKGFLFIDPQGFDAEKDLDFWVEKALEFNKLETN